jgi:hypothetical protein
MVPDASPSLEPTGTPIPVLRRSAFGDVPWRWSDLLIGLAPLVLARGTDTLMGQGFEVGVIRLLKCRHTGR